jgi:nuclear pore complex protein Nup93
MADFQDLLQDAEQMTAQIDKENTGLPRLQRTLSQLFEVNKRKLTKTATGPTNYMSSDSSEINASILLAAKGIDAPRMTQTIENLSHQSLMAAQKQPLGQTIKQTTLDACSLADKLTTIEQLRDIDLQTFLKAEKESALMQCIQETRQRTIQDIEDSFANDLDWEKLKHKIIHELVGSLHSSDASSAATNIVNTTTSSINMGKHFGGQRSLMNDVEMAFAKEVYVYNEKVIESGDRQQADLLSSLVQLVNRFNDKNLQEAWNMLSFMTHDYAKYCLSE